MTTIPNSVNDIPFPQGRIVHRIEWLILAFGIAASAAAGLTGHWDWAAGLITGAVGARLNFHWMKRGVATVTGVGMADSPDARTAKKGVAPAAALIRYVLIGLGAYVIFIYLHFPLVSVVAGFCALGPAVLAASLWEIVQSLS
jgi:hypothetical protein